MSAPAQSNVDVTIGATGFNPYRISQFDNIDLWVKAGMSEQAANDYLGAIKASLNNPNMALDLNIAKNAEYMQVILDTAIARFLAGEIDKEQTMQTVEEGWNELSDDIGREEQLAQYRAKLGLQ
jgi:multiple sugar transport system substrate-binding protein